MVYTGSFSLTAEVEAITAPLAQRVAARPTPAAFRRYVAEVADATHELVSTVVGWLAEVDARRRTEHPASDPGKRAYAVRRIVDLAQRPALPEVGDESLITGAWAASLTAMAPPHSPALAALLGTVVSSESRRAARPAVALGAAVTPAARSIDRAAL